jgi:phosphatidylinositol 4-kinase A
LAAILSLVGYCQASLEYLTSASPKFLDELTLMIQPIVDPKYLITIESLLSTLDAPDSRRKMSSANARSFNDPHLYYLMRIRTRYLLEGEPISPFLIQHQLLRLLKHVCYISSAPPNSTQGFLPLKDIKERFSRISPSTLHSIAELAASQLESVEAGSDFLKFKTSPHYELSLRLKATALRLAAIAFIASGDPKERDLPSHLKSLLIDFLQMSHDKLGKAVLDSVAAVSITSPEYCSDLNRALRNFIVHTHGGQNSTNIAFAAQRLAWCLHAISNDRVVSTLYSLVNVLSPTTVGTDRPSGGGAISRPRTALSLMNFDQHTVASSISLSLKTEDQRQQVYSNVIDAIAEMVIELHDEEIAELMISLLGQKFGRLNDGVDRLLVWGLAKISTRVNEKDFRRILKLQAKARLDPSTSSDALTETIMDAHQYMAGQMDETCPHREILLTEILNGLVEVYASTSDKMPIPTHLLPKYFETLAKVLPEPRFDGLPMYADETASAFRNMWFAVVIHGVHPNNKFARKHAAVLRKIAANSPLLLLESATNNFEADLELNLVLNRTKEGKHPSLKPLEEGLTKLFPSNVADLRSFDSAMLVFVGTVTLVESLRSESGRCALVLDYFDNANLNKSEIHGIMKTIGDHCLKTFMEVLCVGSYEPEVIATGQRELKELLIRCCDPVCSVQVLAQRCCDRLISTYPALLCFEGTTYVLLELLTLLWEGCLSQETDLVSLRQPPLTQYCPKFEFRSPLTGTEIELRDSSEDRKRLLETYHLHARKWLIFALQISPDDTRMVLQAYLAEPDDSRISSQNAPGRQLALEIGRSPPATDSKASRPSLWILAYKQCR